jgi:hypothetical protein
VSPFNYATFFKNFSHPHIKVQSIQMDIHEISLKGGSFPLFGWLSLFTSSKKQTEH